MPPIINITRQQFTSGSYLPWWYTGVNGWPIPYFNESVVGMWNLLAQPVGLVISETVRAWWDDFTGWFNANVAKNGTGTLNNFAVIFEEWCEERGYTPWAAE
jgi:hypothetical protein